MNPTPILSIIIPCYNEQDLISDTQKTLTELLKSYISRSIIHKNSFLLFVDDGSTDRTFELLKSNKNDVTQIIRLSGNRGKEPAIIAGLHFCMEKTDCVVSIDADLQDDIYKIEDMLQLYKSGSHIICGVRVNRDSDSFLKKYSAKMFYALMQFLRTPLIPHHADFRLLSQKALCEILRYTERNIFLRGIILKVNLGIVTIPYTQSSRKCGHSKYSYTR